MLPLIEETDDPMLREEFARLKSVRGFVLNLHRMMAHAPAFMKASGDMAMTLRHKGTLPRSLVELVILRAAKVVDCDYVWERHLSLARDGGVTDQQIAEIAHGGRTVRRSRLRKRPLLALPRRSRAAVLSTMRHSPRCGGSSHRAKLSSSPCRSAFMSQPRRSLKR